VYVFASNQIVVLCIDDEPNILMLRKLLLSIAGYDVLTADNTQDALAMFIDNRVDLVITDQLLPGLSGTETAREMKRIKPHVPIILFTGLVLTKGMTPPEFLTAVGKVVAPRPSSAG